MKNIAIMGGVFDPIHRGHMAVAEAVISEMGYEGMFIPSGDPPHKRCFASADYRLSMARQTAQEIGEGAFVSDMEAARAGTTYTVDTLRQLTVDFPGAALHYVVGGDTLLLLETWRNFDEVAKLLKGILIAIRPGTDEEKTRAEMKRLADKYALSMRLVPVCAADISSTEIRRAILTGEPYANLVIPTVKEYIEEQGLYLEPVREALKKDLRPERYRHVLGTETAAVRLAKRYGEDASVTRLAALLHDCAKDLSLEEMRSMVKRGGLSVEEDELTSRQLLHGPAGAVLAREKYGVLNPSILSAIRWHTVGKRGMELLSKIIYVADIIEPNRQAWPGLYELRETAKANLDEAVYSAALRKCHHALSQGYTLNKHSSELIKTKNMGEKQ